MSGQRSSTLAKASLSLISLLLLLAVVPRVFAQETQREQDWADPYTPLVYPVQNTGAFYQSPQFPSFAQLPIIRPLPDPFRFENGYRDTSFLSWEQHRNDIMAAIEQYEMGPVPDCSDCTITASYAPGAAHGDSGTLIVNVTRNGRTLTLTSGVYIPQGMGSGPFPAMIPMEIASFDFFGTTYYFGPPPQPDYGSLPPGIFQDLPIATIGYVSTQVAGYCFEGGVRPYPGPLLSALSEPLRRRLHRNQQLRHLRCLDLGHRPSDRRH